MRRWVLLLLGLGVLAFLVSYLLSDREPTSSSSGGGARQERTQREVTPALRGAGAARGPRTARRGRVIGVVTRAGLGLPARVEVARLTAVDAPSRWSFVTRHLEAMAPRGDVVASVRADADGRYEIDGLAAGRYEVQAIADDGARGFTRFRLERVEDFAVADLEVGGGTHALDVVAAHADGRAFLGWIVIGPGEFPPLPLDATLARVATDEAGRARFPGLPAGNLRVTALEQRKLIASRLFTLPGAPTLRLVVDAGTRRLTGRVIAREGGSGVEGARIVSWSASAGGRSFHAEARSDADGRFALPVSPSARLVVEASGYASVLLRLHGREEDLEIPLSRGETLHGRVLDASNGRPVAGSRVVAVPVTATGGYRYDLSFTVSDRAGRYTLAPLPREETAVFVCGNGWVSPEFVRWSAESPPNAVVPGAAAPSPVDLEVVPTVTLQGRVVDSDGRPASRCEVRVRPLFYARTLFERSPLGRRARAFSDENGRFQVSDLLPDVDLGWVVLAPGGARAEGRLPPASPGRVLEATLTLPAGRYVRVRVVAAAGGHRVPGAQVAAMNSRFPALAIPDGVWSPTGDDGVARVGPLAAGALDVLVRAPGFAPAREPLPHEATRGAETPVTIELERGCPIGGRVLLPDGAPAAGGEVRIRTDGLDLDSLPEEDLFIFIAEDGTFATMTVSPGTYRVTATCTTASGSFSVTRRVVAPAPDLRLELAERGAGKARFHLRLLGPTGAPVPYGEARLYQGPTSGASCAAWQRRIAAGVLESVLLDEGENLWIEAFDFRDAGSERLPYAPILLGPFSIDKGPTEAHLVEAVTLSGRVIGARGTGVANARVQAYPRRDRPRAAGAQDDRPPHEETRTSGDGRFRLQYLAAAPYRLRIQPPPGFATPEDVAVEGGGPEVVVRLAASVSPTLLVLDADRAPVPGATVVWRDLDRRERGSRRTDAVGRAALLDLDAGRLYQLRVKPPVSRKDVLFERTVERWNPADGEIVLARAYEVSGRVIDEARRPVAGIQVACCAPADSSGFLFARTDAAGTFLFSRLPEGPVALRVQDLRALGRYQEDDRREVPAGSTDVALEIRVGPRLAVRIDGWRPRWRFAAAVLTAQWGEGEVREAAIDAKGRAWFYRLDPKRTYVLWVREVGDGQMVHATGLAPAGGEQRVEVRRGGVVEGEVVVPEGVPATFGQVLLRGEGVSMQTRIADDGGFVFRGVPPGSFTLEARTRHGEGPRYEGTATVAPGTRVRIPLAPR